MPPVRNVHTVTAWAEIYAPGGSVFLFYLGQLCARVNFRLNRTEISYGTMRRSLSEYACADARIVRTNAASGVRREHQRDVTSLMKYTPSSRHP